MISLRRFLLPFIPAALLFALTAPAEAQTGLTEGQGLLDQANFEAAVRAFTAAESATTGLTRRELAALYAGRASAQLALGRQSAMESDLLRLASLDRDYTFGPATRPEIGETFDRVKSAIAAAPSVAARVTEDVGVARVEAEVENDPQNLTRTLRIRGRVAGGTWASSDDGALSVPVTAGARLEYMVEAVGPGGAILASEGTEASPASHTVVGASGGGTDGDDPLDPDDDDDDGSNVGLWVGLAVGVALVAVVVAIVVVAASSGGNDTSMPSPPMIYP